MLVFLALFRDTGTTFPLEHWLEKGLSLVYQVTLSTSFPKLLGYNTIKSLDKQTNNKKKQTNKTSNNNKTKQKKRQTHPPRTTYQKPQTKQNQIPLEQSTNLATNKPTNQTKKKKKENT